LLTLEEHGGLVDLLLTDVVMPEMSGCTLARELKSRWPRTRVLYVSGYSSDLIDDRLLEQDEARLILKPFTAKQLAKAVREVLDN
jgi:CheY-like chemotaxis protein